MLGLFVLNALVLYFLGIQVKARDNYKAQKAANLEDCSIRESNSSEHNRWPKWPQGGNSALHEKAQACLTEQV